MPNNAWNMPHYLQPELPAGYFNQEGQVGQAVPAVNPWAGYDDVQPLAQQAQYAQPPGGHYGQPVIFDEYVKEMKIDMAKMKMDAEGVKVTRSASRPSDEYLALADQITKSGETIRRELAELEDALAKISTLAEAVRDIGSTVHHRMSSLQKAANQLEKWRQSLPQPSSPDSQTGLVASHSVPAPAPQQTVAGAQLIGPGLWQQGPG